MSVVPAVPGEPVVSVVCGCSCDDLRILARQSLKVMVMSFIRLALPCLNR